MTLIRRKGRRLYDDAFLRTGFDVLLAGFNMVFEYRFATATGEEVPNEGSAGSDHDLEIGGTDPGRGVTGGDVSGSVASSFGASNNQVFGYGSQPSHYTAWDNLSATGSIILVFRTSQARAFANYISDAHDLPGGFHNAGIWTVGDPNGKLHFDFVRGSNSQDTGVSGSTVINDNAWYVAVCTQPGSDNRLELYIDGADVGITNGSEKNNWFPDVAQNWDIFNIGSFAGVTSPFVGDIDYLGVTNTVLSLSDAAALSNAYHGT